MQSEAEKIQTKTREKVRRLGRAFRKAGKIIVAPSFPSERKRVSTPTAEPELIYPEAANPKSTRPSGSGDLLRHLRGHIYSGSARRTGLLTCARFSHLPNGRPRGQSVSGSPISPQNKEKTLAETMPE
jgi:hypothetical protein